MMKQLAAIAGIWRHPKFTVRGLPADRLFVLSVLYPAGMGIWLAYRYPCWQLMDVLGGRPQVALALAAACCVLALLAACVLSGIARLFGKRPSVVRVLNLSAYCMLPNLAGHLLVHAWRWLNPGIENLYPRPVDWLIILGIAALARLYGWALLVYGLAVSKAKDADEEPPPAEDAAKPTDTIPHAFPWLQWVIVLLVLLFALYPVGWLMGKMSSDVVLSPWKMAPAVVVELCVLSVSLKKHWFWVFPVAIGVHWVVLRLLARLSGKAAKCFVVWRFVPAALAAILAAWVVLAIAGLQSVLTRERERWPVERQTPPPGFRVDCEVSDRYLIWVPEEWKFEHSAPNISTFVSPLSPQTLVGIEILRSPQARMPRGSGGKMDERTRAEIVWPETVPECRPLESSDGEALLIENWELVVGERTVRLFFIDHASSFARTKEAIFDTVRQSFTPGYRTLWQAPTSLYPALYQ